MSKSKIVAHLATKVGTPKKTAATFFDELFKLAVKECKSGAGKFVIPNIGRAVKAHRKARMGRNPQTGGPRIAKLRARSTARKQALKIPFVHAIDKKDPALSKVLVDAYVLGTSTASNS